MNNTTLQEVTIESGAIGEFAFYGCTALRKVTFGPGVTSIGAYAFYDCALLGSEGTFTIPSTVARVGDFAFGGTSGLGLVVMESLSTFSSNSAFGFNANIIIFFGSETEPIEGWNGYDISYLLSQKFGEVDTSGGISFN